MLLLPWIENVIFRDPMRLLIRYCLVHKSLNPSPPPSLHSIISRLNRRHEYKHKFICILSHNYLLLKYKMMRCSSSRRKSNAGTCVYEWKYFDVVLVPDHKINFHAISLLAFAVLACDMVQMKLIITVAQKEKIQKRGAVAYNWNSRTTKYKVVYTKCIMQQSLCSININQQSSNDSVFHLRMHFMDGHRGMYAVLLVFP